MEGNRSVKRTGPFGVTVFRRALYVTPSCYFLTFTLGASVQTSRMRAIYGTALNG